MSTNRNFYRRQDEEEERNNPYRLDTKKPDSRGRLPRYNRPLMPSSKSKTMQFFGCLYFIFIASCSYLFFNFLLHLIVD